jgi:anthranilate/para-aminobenzoate synthase component II
MQILLHTYQEHLAGRLAYLIQHLPKTDTFVHLDNCPPDNAQILAADFIIVAIGAYLPAETKALILAYSKTNKPCLWIGSAAVLAAVQLFGASTQILNPPQYGVLKEATQIGNASDSKLFAQLPRQWQVAVYQAYRLSSVSEPLSVLAQDKDKNPLVWKHQSLQHWGILFNPASALLDNGSILLKNWLSL